MDRKEQKRWFKGKKGLSKNGKNRGYSNHLKIWYFLFELEERIFLMFLRKFKKTEETF